MIKDKNLNVPDEFKNIYKVLNKIVKSSLTSSICFDFI